MKQIQTSAWAVIGAGPAGIAAIAKLLDSGISASEILWLDPEFAAGDFGTKWQEVSGNTRVKFFTSFLESSPSFGYEKNKSKFALSQMDPEETCLLKDLAGPLCSITQDLREQVQSVCALVSELSLAGGVWQLKTNAGLFQSKQVILATGATPKSLTHEGIAEISLENALHPEKLLKSCQKDDRIAVFGSSHSGILIVKALCELGVKKVVNVYQSPLCFAVPMEDWILFDNTGLKGVAAQWAREHINGKLPDNLVRVHADSEDLANELNRCNKAVYAIGFKTRGPKVIGCESLVHNPCNGIIAPGLFGLGIGFPERIQDPYGHQEANVGVLKFMNTITKLMPLWLNYRP
ncbi:FAD-dependent oxidoreductase [Piscirickettsia litoralis]|uniref:Pyridine nucleotide-disulfide oxidoreductase n=1 Tax=Piscirickettsia litoralis TaxID=1891921 RepID=A0ABX3A3D7_9GAMM|nr:FAD-dependent oxidoreductase [Piscirickettsia litoralis]ODN43392.1 pyridine nucleotide-disulfide oxidoreductase [Piscirickettsia litoralis]